MAELAETNIFKKLDNGFAVSFYSRYYKKFLFASSDLIGGDNVLEAHESASDDRNFFIPKKISDKTYTLFSKYYQKYLFGSADISGGNNVIELHATTEDDRNKWQLAVEPNLVDTVSLYSGYYKNFAFTSSDIKGGDNMVELGATKEERALLQVIFSKPVSEELSDLTYNITLGQILKAPPIVAKTITLTNQQSVTNSLTSVFEYSVEESKSWGNTTSAEVGVSTTVTCGVPFIAEGKISISAKVSNSFNFGESTKTTKKISESVVVSVPAKSSVRTDLVVSLATIDLPFTANVTTIFADGTKLSYKIADTFKSVSAYDVKVVYGKATPLV